MFDLERAATYAALNFVAFDSNSRPVPGAVMVGASLSLVGSLSARRSSFGMPREEKEASPPSFVPAATEMTQGALP